jgi:siroheme synthase
MVKAKEFWNYLCNELDYRFFSGVPCLGLKPLYDEMSSKFMHYIPAANEKIALGLVSGAWLSGTKGAVLMDYGNLGDINKLLSAFNEKYKVPALIIIYDENYKCINKKTIYENLKKLVKDIEKENKPGIFFIGKGDLE